MATLLTRVEALEGETQHLRTELQQTKTELAAASSQLAETKVTVMITVAQFIDSIERLTAGSNAVLRRHVQMDEFGANLDADCDDLFKEALQENLPATFNALERTAVKQMLKQLGKYLCNVRKVLLYHFG